MIAVARRQLRVYGALAAVTPKLFLAYRVWVWMQVLVQVIAIIILVAFWTAIYGDREALRGVTLAQTLSYLILAQFFQASVNTPVFIYDFGHLLRQGELAIELLRPLDFQAGMYVRSIAQLIVTLIIQIPLALVVWVVYRFDVPTDPRIWGAFAVTLLLGFSIQFGFEWALGCLAFYTTEIWGLSSLRFGVATFFSGALIPLALMPDWLRTFAGALPFAQALYVPVSLLTGITPLDAAPRIWALQVVYLIGLLVLSRFVFSRAVRKVTVQGG